MKKNVLGNVEWFTSPVYIVYTPLMHCNYNIVFFLENSILT
jgi:hypothetical protein